MKPTRGIVKPCKKLWPVNHKVWYQFNDDSKGNEGMDLKDLNEMVLKNYEEYKRNKTKAKASLKGFGVKRVYPNVVQAEAIHRAERKLKVSAGRDIAFPEKVYK